MFDFAHPSQFLSAVQTYAGHFYGSMLWDVAGQVYRSWNTCVKLSWFLPRSSHNYFVDGLAGSLPSVKKRILCQNVNFFQNLSSSVSREVRIMSRVFSQDIQSVTGRNLANINNLFNLDPRTDPAAAFKTKMIGYVTLEVD